MRLKSKFPVPNSKSLCLLSLACCLLLFSSCKREQPVVVDPEKPKRPKQEYADKKYLLNEVPDGYYTGKALNHTFDESKNGGLGNYNKEITITAFNPLGANNKADYSYTHIYSSKCVYHTGPDVWKYSEVAFPNTCLTNDYVYADVEVSNTGAKPCTLYFKMFYQNTTYWFPTGDSTVFLNWNFLDNYYGSSEVRSVIIPALGHATLKIPYSIGMNPKHQFDFDPSKDPARAGNYEFMLIYSQNKNELLLQDGLNLGRVNPFAEAKKAELKKEHTGYGISYVSPHKFKFIALDEYFDGVNDLTPDHIYIPKDRDEKKLCDTCTGWYKAVIDESYTNKEYFEGLIHKAPFVKADYGIRKENFKIDSTGITLTIPKSRRGDYHKTWGEFLFGPSFKYGHLTVRAKFPQMMNKHATSNGIVHNLWLYQRDFDEVDTTNPYQYLRGARNKQPYEIDFEIWSSTPYDTMTLWDDESFINYSIVDYMRDPNVQLRPGEQKNTGFYNVERYNKRQASVIGKEFDRHYFDYFHTYELYWYPDKVRYLVDGVEKAVIPNTMAKIPDKHLFLWIGSPMYQDGTYYMQSYIPFLKYDKKTIIDYIKIE